MAWLTENSAEIDVNILFPLPVSQHQNELLLVIMKNLIHLIS
jgi:hypothetical protein